MEVKDPNTGQTILLSFLDYDRIRFDTGQGIIELKHQDANNDITVVIKTLGQSGKPTVYIHSTREFNEGDMEKYKYTAFFKDCTFVKDRAKSNLRVGIYNRREFYPPVAEVCRYVWDVIKNQHLKIINRSGY